MEPGKLGVKLKRFAVVPDRCLVVPVLLQFMRHDLMHPGGSWSHQGQAEHGLAGEIRVDPVRGVEHFYIDGIKASKSADGRCGLVQISRTTVDFNQLHPSFYLNFLLLEPWERFLQVCEGALAAASPPLLHTQKGLHPPQVLSHPESGPSLLMRDR